MKTLLKLPLLAAGLFAAAASPFLHAAVTNATPATPAAPDATAAAPGIAAKHPRLHAMLLRRQAVRQRVAKKLGLSADQISQLKAERAKIATTVKGIRADASLTPEQKKAKVRETLQSARTAMRGVLTPEQQAKAKELRAKVGERLRQHRAKKN